MDKKELRKDPIREKILSSLSYMENNKNSLYALVGVVIAVILLGSYFSTTQKELKHSSSLTFGKVINNSIANDMDASIPELAELIDSGDNSTSASAYVYLLDYYLKNSDFIKLDSLLSIDVDIDDEVLSSKVSVVRGDISFNGQDYMKAIDHYSLASDIYPSIENNMKVKKAIAYYNLENFEMTRSIIDGLMENDDLSFDIKNVCEKYISMLENNQ